VSIINSVLAGLLLAVAGVWAWYAFNRLQQRWLLDAVGPALDRAEARGLRLSPLGYHPRLVAVSGDVEVQWRTGILGPRTLVRTAGGRRAIALVTDGPQLDAALDGR